MERTLTRLDDEIWTVSKIFTPEECEEFIDRGEAFGFEAASVRTASGQQMMTNVRNNDRVIFKDPQLAAFLWQRVREFVPEEWYGVPAAGLFPEFRFYRYDPGQRFRRHRDGSVETEGGEQSYLTFMIYLNADYEGGETVFRDHIFADGKNTVQEIRIRPEVGLGLFFAHERWHEGSPVVSGRKYVLRTDVLFEGSNRPTAPQ